MLKEVVDYIHTNITNSHISAIEISYALGISHSNLYRRIKHITDLSLNEFVRHVRLQNALKSSITQHQRTISTNHYRDLIVCFPALGNNIFHIINAIATREEEVPVEDERDKLINLKSTRNSYYVFTGGFFLSVISLALGMPVYGIFIAFIGFGLIAEI